MEDPIKTLTASVTSSLSEIVTLKDTIEQKNNRISSLEGENSRLSTSLVQEQATVKSMQGTVEQHELTISDLEAANESLKQAKSLVDDELANAKSTIDTLSKQMEESKQEEESKKGKKGK